MDPESSRLSTWAQIAAYIGRDVRTAKRYESERGLPVRRLPGSRSTVFALTSDLDAWRAGALPEQAAPRPSAEAPATPEPAVEPAPAAAEPAPRRRRLGWWLAGGAGLAAVAVGAGALLLRPAAGDAAAITVVVAALQNDTGEPVFDRLVPQLLQIDLTQSPRLQVASEGKVAQTLALMERPRDATLTPAIAREVCTRNNGGVLIAPAAARLGARYVLTVLGSDCVSGRVLSQDQEVVESREAVPQALDRLATRARLKLGESKASISRFDVPLQPARTASFDALRVYSEATSLSRRGQDGEAEPLFRQAIDLDAKFGLAWLGLAQTYYHARQWREDADAMVHAYALRGSMSERDQLFTSYRYHYVVEKDFVAALESLKALALLYPNDATILSGMSFLQMDLGEYDDAIASGEQATRADPRSTLAWTNLARALIRSGKPARARVLTERAAKAGLVDGRLYEMRILAAWEMGDAAEARRLLDATIGKPLERDALLQYMSLVFGQGRGRELDAMIDRADTLGRRQGVRMDWAVVAAAYADLGAVEGARRHLAMVEPDLRSGRYLRAAALVDDPAKVEADLARDIARWPKDTLRNAEYAPEARAILMMRRGDARGAVQALSAPNPYEFRTLEMPYVRAEAFLAAGDAAAAAAAFRAVLAHPGWSNWPQYPLSHLGLARALKLQHDLAGSRREYEAFLKAWSGADPGMPQVLAARTELAALAAAR